ncbi:uncharacterized protein RJT20DRAFT_142165 [Scheffersomyces xylosifermentans]|uniref:uncharacterized protein n=1 Tax=Scheffersomyces xylosifermentans TaxID=1304137 RepID=UPI00315D3723
MSGRFAAPVPKEESALEQFKKTPAYTIGLNVTLFSLGVLFIQSPLMDMLVPQFSPIAENFIDIESVYARDYLLTALLLTNFIACPQGSV